MEKQKEKPESSFKLKKQVWKVLWKMKIPKKVKNFWWRVCRNILATKENLFKRKCAYDSLCPICENDTESIEHLILWCPWAQSVWFGCNIKPFASMGGNASITKSVAEMVDQLTTSEAFGFMRKVANIAWQIWKVRDNFVFNRIKVNPLNTMSLIFHSEKEFSQSQEIPNVLMDNPQSQVEQSSWRAPDMGKIKVNCDVALPKLGNNSKISVVLRDWKGRVMDGLAKTVHAESSLDGELQAIRMPCVMVNSLDLKEAVIELDNKQAISLSVSELVPSWKVCAVVQDIRHLASEGKTVFNWIRRSANKLAH